MPPKRDLSQNRKEAIKLRKEQHEDTKRTLYNQAVPIHYGISYRYSSIPKLRSYISNYNEAINLGFEKSARHKYVSLNNLIKFVRNNKPAEIEFIDEYYNEMHYHVHIILYHEYINPATDIIVNNNGKDVKFRRRINLPITINNQQYTQQTITLLLDDVYTKKILENIYTNEQYIKIFEIKPTGMEHTEEFTKFVNDLYPNYYNGGLSNTDTNTCKLLHQYSSVIDNAALLKIVQISPQIIRETIDPETSIQNRKYYDNIDNKYIYNRYIKYNYSYKDVSENLKNLFKNKLDEDFIKEHNLKKACVLEHIIKTFSKNWNKYQDKLKGKDKKYLTRDYLIKLFNLTEDDLGVNFQLMKEKFFKPNKLTFYIYDDYNNIIDSYVPEKRNRNILGVLNCLQRDNHLYLMNNELNRLKEIRDLNDDKNWFIPIGNRFYIHNNEPTNIVNLFIDEFINFKDIRIEIDKIYNIYTSTDLKLVLEWMVRELKYIPKINRFGRGNISNIKMIINDSQINIKNPDSDDIGQLLNFENDTQLSLYLQLSQKVKSIIINNNNISEYNPQYIKYSRQLTPRALVGKINNTTKTPNYKCDFSKFYAYILIHLVSKNGLIIKSSFDDWKIYKNEAIYPSTEYIVKRNDKVDIPDSVKNTILNNSQTIYSGMILNRIKEIIPNFNDYIIITHYCESVSINKDTHGDLKTIAKTVYDDTLLNNSQKKNIFNFLTGQLEKVKNKTNIIEIFNNYKDAMEFLDRVKNNDILPDNRTESIHKLLEWDENIVDDTILNNISTSQPDISIQDLLKPIQKDDVNIKRLYTLEKRDAKDLSNGFYSIKCQIYGYARYLMYRLYDTILNEYEGIPTHMRTDCIYFYTDKKLNLEKYETSYENLGSVSIEKVNIEDEFLPRNNITNDKEDIQINTVDEYKIEYQTLKHEEDYKSVEYKNECKELLNSMIGSKILISGSEFGVGKTSLVISYLKDRIKEGKKVLVSAPTNKRCIELSGSFSNVKTIHSLLKIRMSETRKKQDELEVVDDNKLSNLSSIDFIFIDEIFMLEYKVLQKLKWLLSKYPNITLIATGDVNQQYVDTNLKVQNATEYRTKCMSMIFNKGIMLNVNKRFTDINDRKNIKIIKNELMANNRKSFLKYVNTFDDMDCLYNLVFDNEKSNTGKVISYFQDTRNYVNNLLHNERVKRNLIKTTKIGCYDLYKGVILVVKKRLVCKKTILHTNSEWIVDSWDDNFVYISDETILNINDRMGEKSDNLTAIDRSLFNQQKNGLLYFTYNYGYSSIQSQGDTYTNSNVILFDINSPLMSNNSIYTAIGRARTLKDVYIYNGKNIISDIKEDKIYGFIENRIDSHKLSDKNANRKYNEKEYITTDWIFENLKGTPACYHCNIHLSLDLKNSKNLFSIDRINDSIAHTKNNCIMSCVRCNKGHQNKKINV